MRHKLNVLIGLHVLVVILLGVLVRFTFTIFFYSMPRYDRCEWDWSDGKTAQECRRTALYGPDKDELSNYMSDPALQPIR